MSVLRFGSVAWLDAFVQRRSLVFHCATTLAVLAAVLVCACSAQAAGIIEPTTPSLAPAVPRTGADEISLKPSKTKPYTPCPPRKGKLRANCNIVIEPRPSKTGSGSSPNASAVLQDGSGVYDGWSPADLQDAYSIPTSGGKEQTVAVIDAYGDPTAESDLAVYREHYGLPPCTKSNGCFRKVNQNGFELSFPPPDPIWGLETSLDLDMVSAACPECKILLVEAESEFPADMAAAVETAVKLGATEISNSYGYPERYQPWCPNEKGCSEYAKYYDHPGIPITVSSGDFGYENKISFFGEKFSKEIEGAPDWPAASPDVIAVGGTELLQSNNSRGWIEQAWAYSGGGCSLHQPKPAWQFDSQCANRFGNDVAAVASNLSVYSTPYTNGWEIVGGTSASAPLIAGILAHTSKAVRDEGPEAFYRRRLLDINSGGIKGFCKGHLYLCSGVNGYDGPTGWGVPDGLPEATSGFEPATGPPTDVTTKKVTMNGWVNPEGLATTYSFEYGKTTSYGTSVPASPGSVGSGTLWKPVSQTVSLPYGSYHYRLVTTNSSGTDYGKDRLVTVSPWVEAQEGWVQNAENYYFTTVSCATTSMCMAIFSIVEEFDPFKGEEGEEEKIQPWPGADPVISGKWDPEAKYLPKPSGEIKSGEIRGISCPSSSACNAVGWYTLKNNSQFALGEVWNGSSWQVKLPESPPEATSVELNGVSCWSSSGCLAVGTYRANKVDLPLAELWNGEKWELKLPKLPSGATEAVLTGVSCPESGQCRAVGYSCAKCPSEKVTLIERWSGGVWEVEPSPNEVSQSNQLNGISCPTVNVCTAVGDSHLPGGGWEFTLAERLEDGKWSIQATPNPTHYSSMGAGAYSSLSGSTPVSCPSVTYCVATIELSTVEEAWEEELLVRPQTAIWDGKEWQLQEVREPEDVPGPLSVQLGATSCPAVGNCVAVGRLNGFDSDFYLGEGFSYEASVAEMLSLTLPTVEVKAASQVEATAALLSGVINPNGIDTSYQFEYGTTKSYGQSAPGVAKGIGSGSSNVEVSQAISGLKPNTEYHFRLATFGEDGATHSVDKTFTTGKLRHWFACTKQTGGRYLNAQCVTEGGAKEWESLHLKTAESVSITAKGNPIAITATISGTKGTISCETEVTNASLENPTGGGNGVGSADVKYKGCKGESGWSGCTVTPGSTITAKLSLITLDGKAETWLSPKGANLGSFTLAACSVSGTYELTGKIRGLYSNVAAKVEFNVETTAEGLKLNNSINATAAGSIKLETTAGGYVSVRESPVALTEAATSVKLTEATLNGTVNPEGADTHYQFEYGKTTSYGQSAPAEAKDVGEGLADVKVAEALKELLPGTTYHYRLMATNGAVVGYGVDKTFTTTTVPQHWFACTKQVGGKYVNSKCTLETAPKEWESLKLKEAEKTTITAKGNPITFSAAVTGISGSLFCETEVTNASLENPSGGGNGTGNAEVKYKGCKAEGTWGEKGCKVTPGAAVATKLDLVTIEGKAHLAMTPKTGETLASFTFAECTIPALNGSWSLTGTARGLYSNAASQVEFNSETTAEGLKLKGTKATAVGSIKLETSAGGYISAAGVPVAITESATSVNPTEATLNGTVNPEGADTHYQFEYGKTTSYGQSIPVEAKDAGEGVSDVKAAETLKGLLQGTTYHYRLMATNGVATAYGADKTFTTTALPQRWFACTKQVGGKYKDGKCAVEGAPKEWELLKLKEAEKTTITAKGNPITVSTAIAGISGSLSCEVEVTNASLENPSGGGNGVGSAEVKYKGCKGEGNWESCKITPGATAVASKLELTTRDGKADVLLSPKEGTTLASITFAECKYPALNAATSLTGTLRGLYSNAASQIEFTTESTGAKGELFLRGAKATAVGSIKLETSAAGYIMAAQ